MIHTARRRVESPLGAALIAVSVAGVASGCGGGVTPTPGAVAYENGLWYDGSGFTAGSRTVLDGVFVDEEEIVADSTVDLGGRHVVPPFGESHTHLLEPRGIEAYVQHYMTRGVFYVRELSGIPSMRPALDALASRPDAFDLVSAQLGFTGPGGHPIQIVDQIQQIGWVELDPEVDHGGVFVVETEADIDAAWPLLMGTEPDLVKIFLHYSEAHAERTGQDAYLYRRGLDPALAAPIVERAHAAGLEVAAHVFTMNDAVTAIEAGVDHLAHFPGQGFDVDLGVPAFEMSDEIAAQIAASGVTVTTTLSDMAGANPAEIPERVTDYVAEVIGPNLEKMKAAGVPFVIGTDRPRATTDAEIAMLSALGLFDNAELLYAWAVETPRRIFPDRRLGGFDLGYEASFLALDGDPLADIANTGRISMWVKEGVQLQPNEIPFP